MKYLFCLALFAALTVPLWTHATGAFAGPFDAQMSGSQLQSQREHDFLCSSLEYLVREAANNKEERERIMRILTAGGFSSEQLARAIYYIAKPPPPSGKQLDPETLIPRKEVAGLVLAHGRTTFTPFDPEQIRMVRVEEMGLYVEIAGKYYTGEEASELSAEILRSYRLSASWNEIESAIHELERLISEQPRD